MKATNSSRSLRRLVPRRLAYIVINGIILFISLVDSAAAITVCSGGGAGCTGSRSCRADIFVPTLNQTLEIDVSGPAFASVSDSPDHERLELTWILSDFTRSHPTLGDIRLSLSSLTTSHGLVEPVSPDQPTFFSAHNTNDLFFRYEFSGLGIPALLSDDPVRIQAIINNIPPDGAVYHLTNPVNLFAERDPSRSTVAIITSAEIRFTSTGPSIELVSPCPIPEPSTMLLLCSGLAGIIIFMREGKRGTGYFSGVFRGRPRRHSSKRGEFVIEEWFLNSPIPVTGYGEPATGR